MKKKVQQNGWKKLAIYFSLFIVLLIPICIKQEEIVGSFQGVCMASTVEELEKCYRQKRYTKVKTKHVYDANYHFLVDNQVVGKFIDIDLNGRSLIALVDTKTADILMQGENEKEISGKLELFDQGVMKEAMDEIKKQYVVRYQEQYTEDDILSMFTTMQLNQYAENPSYLIPIVLLALLILFILWKCIGAIKMIAAPGLYPLNGKVFGKNDPDLEKVTFEYEHGPYIYQTKNIKFTNHYVVSNQHFNVFYHDIQKAVWAYVTPQKAYGVIPMNHIVTIRFDDGLALMVKLDPKEQKKVFEVLRVKCPNIVIGYDRATEKKYQNDPKSVLK